MNNLKDFDLKKYLNNWRVQVDETLDQVLPPEDEYPQSVRKAMRYSVFAGGKRLRPILCIAGCQAVGGKSSSAVAPFCAKPWQPPIFSSRISASRQMCGAPPASVN